MMIVVKILCCVAVVLSTYGSASCDSEAKDSLSISSIITEQQLQHKLDQQAVILWQKILHQFQVSSLSKQLQHKLTPSKPECRPDVVGVTSCTDFCFPATGMSHTFRSKQLDTQSMSAFELQHKKCWSRPVLLCPGAAHW